jgi:hypothetical protein
MEKELWKRNTGQRPNAEEGQKVLAFHTSWTTPKGQSIRSIGMCTSLSRHFTCAAAFDAAQHLVMLLPDGVDSIASLDDYL